MNAWPLCSLCDTRHVDDVDCPDDPPVEQDETLEERLHAALAAGDAACDRIEAGELLDEAAIVSLTDDLVRAHVAESNAPVLVTVPWLRAALAEVDEARRTKAAAARAVDALAARFPVSREDDTDYPTTDRSTT